MNEGAVAVIAVFSELQLDVEAQKRIG